MALQCLIWSRLCFTKTVLPTQDFSLPMIPFIQALSPKKASSLNLSAILEEIRVKSISQPEGWLLPFGNWDSFFDFVQDSFHNQRGESSGVFFTDVVRGRFLKLVHRVRICSTGTFPHF